VALAAVVQRPAALAVAEPQWVAVSGARPMVEAAAAPGSLAKAVAAAGSPAAVVPEAAPVVRRIAVAPPMVVCGWQCRAAVREDGPAGDRQREVAACWEQPLDWAQPSSAQPRAVLPERPQAACGSRCQDAIRHPEGGGNPDRPAVSRCPAPQCLGHRYLAPRCLAPRSSAQPRLV
jgi:hypothetical protein